MKVHLDVDEGPADVSRIQAAIIASGFRCERNQAGALWGIYSSTRSSTWLVVPDDLHSIFTLVEPFIATKEKD